MHLLVSSAAVFWGDVTQRLLDIPKNGCEGNYTFANHFDSLLEPMTFEINWAGKAHLV